MAFEQGATVRPAAAPRKAVIAYQPFVEVLHQLLGDPGSLPLRSAGLGSRPASWPGWCLTLPDLFRANRRVKAEPGTERYLLYEAVVAALHHVARLAPPGRRPRRSALGRTHRRSAFSSIGQASPAGSAPDLGTYRETDLSRTHPLAAVTGRATPGDADSNESTSPVSMLEGVAKMVANRTGVNVPAVVARRSRDETEGNPFFVEEVVAHLIEIGAIGPGVPWPSADQLHSLEIPEGIREVGREASRPAYPTGPTAPWRLAAVIGREFDGDLCNGSATVPTPTSSSTTSTRLWRHASWSRRRRSSGATPFLTPSSARPCTTSSIRPAEPHAPAGGRGAG